MNESRKPYPELMEFKKIRSSRDNPLDSNPPESPESVDDRVVLEERPERRWRAVVKENEHLER
jgi:hypothetical protein